MREPNVLWSAHNAVAINYKDHNTGSQPIAEDGKFGVSYLNETHFGSEREKKNRSVRAIVCILMTQLSGNILVRWCGHHLITTKGNRKKNIAVSMKL